MEIQSECYPCILKMLGTVAEKTLEEQAAGEFLADIQAGEAFQGNAAGLQSPIVVRDAWTELVRRLDDPDPVAELKQRQNEAALALLPTARIAVAEADDSLATAVTLAIVGNSLDLLVPKEAAADDLMSRLDTAILNGPALSEFRRRIAEARSIAYLGDNCGEAVFDRLLIETITESHDVEVTFVVRSCPALNDITLPEAQAIGLDTVARIIDNGIDDPLPSTLLEHLGPEARAAAAEADLVISKGGGNFELLEGHSALAGRATFLVDGKCAPLCRANDVERGDPILRNE